MAGRASADLYVIATLRLETKLVVKRCHAVDLACRQVQQLPDPIHCIARQIAVDLLNLLEDGDQRIAFGVGILGKNGVNVGSTQGDT